MTSLSISAVTSSPVPPSSVPPPQLRLSAVVTVELATGVKLWEPVWQNFVGAGLVVHDVTGTLDYNGQSHAVSFQAAIHGDGSWFTGPDAGGGYTANYWVFAAAGLGYTTILFNDHGPYLLSFADPSGFGFQVPVSFTAVSTPDGNA